MVGTRTCWAGGTGVVGGVDVAVVVAVVAAVVVVDAVGSTT